MGLDLPRKFVLGIFHYSYAFAAAVLLGPLDVYERLRSDSWPEIIIPDALGWIGVMAAILFASFMTYRDLWKELPQSQKDNIGYLSFREASELALREYVRDETIAKWDGTRFLHSEWVSIHLEEAVKESDLNAFQKLHGGRFRSISYDAAKKSGLNQMFYFREDIFLRRKDLKRAWRAYAERHGIEKSALMSRKSALNHSGS